MRGKLIVCAAMCMGAHSAFAHPGHDAGESGDVVFIAAQRELAKNRVQIEVRGEYRYITSNGIPDHEPGAFPNRGNPNSISEQSYRYRVPANPSAAEKLTSTYGQPFGVAINGVPFDPGTAEVWSKNGRTHGNPQNTKGVWNYDALSGKIDLGVDDNNAHVQPNGAYHYHGIPNGLVDLIKKESKPAMILTGYAADGFPIYAELAYTDADDASSEVRKMKPSYRVKEGNRPGGDNAPSGKYDGTYIQDFEYVEGLGDLDECNGRTGVTPEYPDGTYYYVLTEDYPMIPRAFRGTPDESFARRRGGQAGGPGGPGGENRGGPPGGEEDDRRPPRPGDRPPPRDGDRPPPPR